MKFLPDVRFVIDTRFDDDDRITSLLQREDVRRDLERDDDRDEGGN